MIIVTDAQQKEIYIYIYKSTVGKRKAIGEN